MLTSVALCQPLNSGIVLLIPGGTMLLLTVNLETHPDRGGIKCTV